MKRILTIILASFFFIIFISSFIFAGELPPRILLEKHYDNSEYDNFRSGKHTKDGGYIFAGDSHIPVRIFVQYVPYLTVQNVRTFDAWIIKVNSDGEPEWNFTIGGPIANDILHPYHWTDFGQFVDDKVFDIIQTSDGSFMVTGYTQFYGSPKHNEQHMWIFKLSNDGKLQWNKTFDVSAYGFSIVETNDGNYLITGENGETDGEYVNRNVWLLKIDENGNEIWNKTYPKTPIRNGYGLGSKIFKGNKNNFIITDGHGDLINIDDNGNILWRKNSSDFSCLGSIILPTSNGYLSPSNNGNFCLSKIDENGNEIWNKTYSINAHFVYFSKDGNFILYTYNPYYINNKIYKINEFGDIFWSMDIDDDLINYSYEGDRGIAKSPYFIDELNDGSYIIGGGVIYDQDFLFIKTSKPEICSSNWVLNDTWSECKEDNKQYRNYYNTNNCLGAQPNPKNRTCKYCKENWSCSKYGECIDDLRYCDQVNDINSCNKNYAGDLSEFIPINCLDIACLEDSDCGTDGFIGNAYCSDNDIEKDYQYFTCNNPGTLESSCLTNTENRIINSCDFACFNASCVRCNENLDCNDNDEKTEDICFNSGTSESYCGSQLIPELIIDSPIEDLVYDRIIPFNITSNQKVDQISYIDNSDEKSKEKMLCKKNCFDYGKDKPKNINFNEGFHNLTFRVTKNNSIVYEKNLNFIVDSKKPRILKTQPIRGFVSGIFNVEFSEENPKELVLFYGIGNDTNSKIIDIENECIFDQNKHSCQVNVDLSNFDKNEITYWFELKDFAGNKDKSRDIILNFDSGEPILNSFNYSINNKKIEFIFNITEDNFKEINYIDLNDKNLRERKICLRLEDGICKVIKSFINGDHNLTINILDKAGNSIQIPIEFSIQ